MNIRQKKEILRLLATEDLAGIMATLAGLPAAGLINPIFSGICHNDVRVRWHAIVAMGQTVARLADAEMEAARVVMRRLMWSLNDESGGIGWGAPEAMAEIIAIHDGLANEYAHILVTYMREDGSFLEYPPLQRGLMWGICRAAETRRATLHDRMAPFYLSPYLESADATVRGLAARAFGLLRDNRAEKTLILLRRDQAAFPCYSREEDRLIETTVAEQAAWAITRLSRS